MVSDIDLRTYYIKYQKDVSSRITELYNDKKLKIDIKDKTKTDIINNKDLYNKYNIDITFVENNDLFLIDDDYITKLKNNVGKDLSEIRTASLLLLKYINIIKRIYAIDTEITAIYKRKNISFKEYKDYLKKYYRYGVHKCVLEGYAYLFQGGLGMLIINRWNINKNVIKNRRHKYIDFNETNKKKKEILEKGGTLYNEEDAEKAKLRGIKYNGEKYIVYNEKQHLYEVTIINNRRYNNRNIVFKVGSRIDVKLRGKTQKELAELCKTKEDVFNLPCDVTHKLGVYNNFDKTAYLNYIRNEEQNKYNYGTHNSKNRQRF